MLHLSSKLGSYYRSHRLDTFTFAPPKAFLLLALLSSLLSLSLRHFNKDKCKAFSQRRPARNFINVPQKPKKKRKKRQSAHFAATSFWCQLLANLSLRKSAVGCSWTKQHDKNEK